MRETLGAASPYLRRYWRGLAIGAGGPLLMDLVAVSIPLLIKHAIDEITRQAALTTIVEIAALTLLAATCKGFLQLWSRRAIINVSRDVEFDLRGALFRHLLTLSPDFYRRTRTGDLMALATNDLNAVRMMAGPGLMNWFDSCFVFLPACAAMAFVDWRLTLAALI